MFEPSNYITTFLISLCTIVICLNSKIDYCRVKYNCLESKFDITLVQIVYVLGVR